MLEFPEQKVALVKGGFDRVPTVIDKVVHKERHLDYSTQFGALNPIEVLSRNLWSTTFNDEFSMARCDLAGIEHIMIHVHYLHSDSTWPDIQSILANQ